LRFLVYHIFIGLLKFTVVVVLTNIVMLIPTHLNDDEDTMRCDRRSARLDHVIHKKKFNPNIALVLLYYYLLVAKLAILYCRLVVVNYFYQKISKVIYRERAIY
jgi:hypothetical protein